MGAIFGSLRLADNDRVYNSTAGQRAIYDAITEYLAVQNAALNAMTAIFVDETTEDFQRRYRLPGSGRLQRRGSQAAVAAVKNVGSWDVAFPLEDYGAAIAGDFVSFAYMTAADLERHVNTVLTQNVNTVRWEILRALMRKTARTFVDETRGGTLTIQPLANGDAVVYPPVVGSETEATDNHYLTSGYAAANISDSNDPFAGIVIPELEEHFGQVTGGSPICTFINSAQIAKVAALAGVVEVQDRWVAPGDSTATPTGLPAVPGKIIGRHISGTWISAWDYIPANYMVGIHLEAPKPLIKRVDPADTGLPRDLALVSRDLEMPFENATWVHRFGFGVGNRLNGVCLELTADATYDDPSAYA